jgi:hypothetical protein
MIRCVNLVDPVTTMSTYSWPLRSYLELGALPSAVPSARLHARLIVGEWACGSLASTVELIVSELMTNGIQASTGLTGSRYQGQWTPGPPPVRLWLQSDCTRVLIQVWDASDRMPHLQDLEPCEENGRGLLIVTQERKIFRLCRAGRLGRPRRAAGVDRMRNPPLTVITPVSKATSCTGHVAELADWHREEIFVSWPGQGSWCGWRAREGL